MTTGPGSDVKGRGTRWFYSQLPVDIAAGPVGTLIQLYILESSTARSSTWALRSPSSTPSASRPP